MDPRTAMLSALRGENVDPRTVFVAAIRIKEQAEENVKYHPGYCECTTCEWLDPTVATEPWHGTVNGYGYHKCRCDRCRKANRHYANNRR